MPAIDRELELERRGDVTIVRLSANVADAVYCQELERPLTALLDDNPTPRIVLDFDAVVYGQSALYGFLVQLHDRAKQAGGGLRLCNLSPTIHAALEITRLDELLDVYADEEAALAGWCKT